MLSLFFALTISAAGPCGFEGEPRDWTVQALESWDRLDHQRLGTTRPVTPTLVLFDATCVYRLTPDADADFMVGGRRYAVEGREHGGVIPLPGGGELPARRVSFAFPAEAGGMNFVMALPALWRAEAATEPRDPAKLAMLVFMHEFAHTQQGEGLGRRIDALVEDGLPPEVDDDIVQKRFRDTPEYVAAWEAERDLYYAASGAPDAAEARRLLAEAWAMTRARRARWFTGDQAILDAADDVFLTFEGSGNWAAWTWLVDPSGGGLSPAEATAFVRGRRSPWSQDQGLAVMLTLDRLAPDWPGRAFGPEGATADALIARALEEDPR